MKLSVVVLTKNSQEVLPDCLKSVQKAFQIVVVDDNSTDDTLKIAKKFISTKNIYSHQLTTFPSQRNWAAKKATGDWFIFLDADERITKKGWQEIKKLLPKTTNSAYRFKRLNHFYGQKIKHGGYWPDYQTRLFKQKNFKGIKGVTHENYQFKGTLGTLDEPVLHFPDRSVSLGLYKSKIWTKKEAEALFKANHPKITWWRILKVMITEFYYRYLKKQGFRDGYIGFAESLTQAINKFFIYQQVWELQQVK